MIDGTPTHQWLLDKLEELPDRSQYHIGEGVIKCRRSGSDPMGIYYQFYIWEVDPSDENKMNLALSICTCEGFRFNDHCKHLDEGTPA